ncbi:hypothetical protein [Natribacillus halophilus]|uniref:Uncharacterized protein n=1 Tax=Natribacillus halophilus TaxID=549003 RepID=A0A1G8R2M0_9BACI|nr:hypothetical protein [Natribacillus halophilus]SDJ11244.1 hypothetical protein SAMN04488123_11528 [Natribacillus halophilus]
MKKTLFASALIGMVMIGSVSLGGSLTGLESYGLPFAHDVSPLSLPFAH